MTADNPLDTSRLDGLPIRSFLYEPTPDADGRIVYANAPFLRDWAARFPSVPCIGARLVADAALDADVFHRMEACRAGDTRAFSAVLGGDGLCVHFQPITDADPSLGGFLLTPMPGAQEIAKLHFLRSIRQIESAAVLMREAEGGALEAVFASREFARVMECTQEEAMRRMDGHGFLDSTHPDDRRAVRRMLRLHASDSGTNDLVIRKRTAAGRTVWCHVYYTFIDDFNEHYVYCTYFDVTASRRYEQRLRTTYMSIINTFYREDQWTLGLFRVNLTRDRIEDMKGRGLFGADASARSFSDILRLRTPNYLIPDERAHFLEAFSRESLIARYLAGEAQRSEHLFSRRRDGRLCYVCFTAIMTRHPISGDIVAFLSEKEDNAGKVKEVLLTKILARRFDMVACLANERYDVVISDATSIVKGGLFPASLSGRYEDYLEKQVIPVLDGDDARKAAMADALRLSTVLENVRRASPYIVDIACGIDGETYYKRFDFYSVDPDASFLILLKNDTTESQKKQIEQNARLKDALEKARQASVAKTAFLSRMSHEIRTPMNAIIGLDNIALHEKNISPSIKEHLEKIGSSARYLLTLINDILDMTRIESGRMSIRNEEFSFRAFIEQIETLALSQCRDRGLQFACTTKGPVRDYYIGDDTKLKQVLINILGNAVKFTEPGGRISLSVECTARYSGQSIFRFAVQDTGIGIEEAFLPKLFEAFSQEDITTTSNYGGSGLGMAITKNLVEMMNGSITVASKKGVGSTFTISLPLKDSPRRDNEQAEEIHPENLSVLVIDDEPLAREHAEFVLAEAGITASSCGSGSEAAGMVRLRQARRESYNLILVDLMMPDEDGIEVTRRLRRLLGEDMTVIILTAHDWSEKEREAREAGVDAFMAKPLSSSSLMYEFRRAFRRKKPKNARAAQTRAPEGSRILVAEDMRVNAEIVEQLLAMQGFQAERAENGEAAVRLFSESRPDYYDAILMDVRMPVMDGLAATKAIRALPRPDSRTIPIIAMTANAFDEDVQRSLQAGMNAHLAKPVEPEHMYRTLADLIGERKNTQEKTNDR